jgi:hypothetical protein
MLDLIAPRHAHLSTTTKASFDKTSFILSSPERDRSPHGEMKKIPRPIPPPTPVEIERAKTDADAQKRVRIQRLRAKRRDEEIA